MIPEHDEAPHIPCCVGLRRDRTHLSRAVVAATARPEGRDVREPSDHSSEPLEDADSLGSSILVS